MADHGLALYQECMISRVLGVRDSHTFLHNQPWAIV